MRLPVVTLVCLLACTKGSDYESNAAINVTASSTVARTPSCGEHLIRRDGIGKLKIGMHADSVKAACHVAFDTIRPGPEGMSQRVMLVAFPPTAVEAEVVNDTVWRLDVTSPGIQTVDSIGVGTPLRKALEAGDAQGMVGEGGLFLIFRNRCGMSFELRGELPTSRPQIWSKKELAKLSPDIQVDRILVFKCAPGAGAWLERRN